MDKKCEFCGKRVPNYKARQGQRFCSILCANRWKAIHVITGMKYKKRKEKEKPVNYDYYKRGKEYCKNYDDTNIQCVVCYERRYLDTQEKECEL